MKSLKQLCVVGMPVALISQLGSGGTGLGSRPDWGVCALNHGALWCFFFFDKFHVSP